MTSQMSDRTRQVGVTAAAVFCAVGTLIGTGVLGTEVADSAGGALAADATLLAPAGPAFSIWSVIYLGLAAFTVWQWLPGRAGDPRMRRIGWLAAASMVLNAVWLLVTQRDWIWVSVLVILALVAVLAALMSRLVQSSASTLLERIVVDATFGLYLGWVCVATCANIAAAFVSSGVTPSAGVADLLAVLVLIAVAGLGVALAARLHARWAVALAAAWGLAWIAVGRLLDAPESTITGIAAAIAAIVVLGAVVIVRVRESGGPAPR